MSPKQLDVIQFLDEAVSLLLDLPETRQTTKLLLNIDEMMSRAMGWLKTSPAEDEVGAMREEAQALFCQARALQNVTH